MRRTDENISTTVSTTPLKPPPVIGSGMKLLDSSGDVTDDETENPHEELPTIEDEPEPETVQPPAGREEKAPHRYPCTQNKKSFRSLWDIRTTLNCRGGEWCNASMRS